MTRPRMQVVGQLGNLIEVPEECPIPGTSIISAFCDWANGWLIALADGNYIQEVPGPRAPEAKWSDYRRMRLNPGWYLSDGQGWSIDDPQASVLASVSEDCDVFPSMMSLRWLYIGTWEPQEEREQA